MTLAVELTRAQAVLWKELRIEGRTRANLSAVVFLAVLMLLLFGFALGPDAGALRDAAGGMIWLAVLFSAAVAFNRSYQVELDNQALEGLLLYPGARWPIYLGKLAANLLFVLTLEAIVLPLAIVLFGISLAHGPWLLAVVLLSGTLGVVTLGTLYAAIACRTRAREVLLPLLLLPMLVPVLIAATKATNIAAAGNVMGDASAWLRMLVAYDLIFFIASVWVFDAVIGG